MIFVLPISNPGFPDFPSTGGILKSGIRNWQNKNHEISNPSG
jgi:hypothetical protein